VLELLEEPTNLQALQHLRALALRAVAISSWIESVGDTCRSSASAWQLQLSYCQDNVRTAEWAQ